MHVCANNEMQPSTDQGVSDFEYDTVDKLHSNLFAVSDYYEHGADIHLTHSGFAGVTGIFFKKTETNIPERHEVNARIEQKN